MPVNTIWIEDNNEPIHAEDDCNDDHGHLGDLQQWVKEEWVKAAVYIHHITTRINRIKNFNKVEEKLEGEVADINIGQHDQ